MQADKKSLETSARLAVLYKCLNKISQILTDRGSTLLCAKLLVISRLLHRTLSGGSDQPFLSNLGARLGHSRQRLLRHIDKRFMRVNISNVSLVEDMTAFALATSSTPSDVLKHLHFMRSNVLGRRSREKRNIQDSILTRINMFLHTLRETKAYFPEIFAASLKLLSTKPLLEDSTILELDDLGLDMHLPWLPTDLVNYTPYTRHDELDRSKATQLLRDWGVQACKILGEAVNLDIKDSQDLPTVLDARRAALQLWLTSRRVTSGLPWSQVLDNLRDPFDRQARAIIQNSATSLRTSVCGIVVSTIQDWSTEAASITRKELWTKSLAQMYFGNGAIDLQRAILDSVAGKHSAIERLVRLLDSNRRKVQDIQAALKEMKDTRWEYDDIDDDEDNSDDYSSSSISKLSKNDPEELQQVLCQSMVEAIQQIDETLTSQVEADTCGFGDYKSTGPFVLRSLRELRYHVPRLLQSVDKAAKAKPLCFGLVNSLHESLAKCLVNKKEASFSEAVRRLVHSRYNIESLWTGSPPLPVQPSTGILQTLRKTVKDMEAIGFDMWSVDALEQLKVAQQEALTQIVEVQLGHVRNLLSSGRESKSAATHGKPGMDEGKNGNPPQNGPISTSIDSNVSIEQPANGHANAPENILTVLGIPNGDSKAEEPATISDGTATMELEGKFDTPPAQSDDVEKPLSELPPKLQPARLPTQLDSKLIQIYYDVLYLDSAFSLPYQETEGTQSPLSSVAQKVKEVVAIDEAADARIVKSAADYWRRTYLLFGLLGS